jgi:hypothetical protein
MTTPGEKYTNGEVKTMVAPLFDCPSDDLMHVVIVGVHKQDGMIGIHHTASSKGKAHDDALNALVLAQAQAIVCSDILQDAHHAPE